MTKQKLSTLNFFIFGIFIVLVGIFIFSISKDDIQIVPSPVPTQSQLSNLNSNITYAKVTRVIDGDTIVIDTGQHVRYLGMNTPELESSECYATEASEINKNLVLGKTVKLVKDFSEIDKYGRLLRFVYVDDIFVDDYLVKNGSARIMTVPPDTEFEDILLESQKYAKKNKLGLWGKCF